MFSFGNNNKRNKLVRLLKKISKKQKEKDVEYNGKPNLVVFSGAGISKESGIDTFRDSDGLWENHSVNEIATPSGYNNNPELVTDFYNARRKNIREAEPNSAHITIAELEKHFNVTVVTQNIDDLHERGGSSLIYHLHGEINKVQANGNERLVYEAELEQDWQERCPTSNAKLRPYVVWFSERPRFITEAQHAIMKSDVVIVVGTSLAVLPAAGLIDYIPKTSKFIVIDPNMPKIENKNDNLKWIEATATEGFALIKDKLINFSIKFNEEKKTSK